MGVRLETLVVIMATAVQSGSSALAYWLSARLQTPSELGIAMSVMGLATTLSNVPDLGIINFTVREMAASSEPLPLFRRTLGNKLMMGLIMAAAWSGVTACLALNHHATVEAMYYGPLFLVGTLEATYQAGLRGTGRTSLYALSISSDKIAFLASTLILGLICHAPQLVFPIGLLAGSATGLMVASPMIKEVGLLAGGLGSFRELILLFRQSITFGIVGLANMSQRLDVTAVSMLAGPVEAGYYAAPARLSGPLSMIPLALGTVIFPRSARTSDTQQSHRELMQGIVLIAVLMGPVIIAMFTFATPVITMALGHRYLSSVPVLRVVLIGLLFAVFIEPLATFLQGKRDERFVSQVIVISTIIGLAVCGVGAKVAGATGAGLGYTIRQCVILVLIVHRYRSLLRSQPNRPIEGLMARTDSQVVCGNDQI